MIQLSGSDGTGLQCEHGRKQKNRVCLCFLSTFRRPTRCFFRFAYFGKDPCSKTHFRYLKEYKNACRIGSRTAVLDCLYRTLVLINIRILFVKLSSCGEERIRNRLPLPLLLLPLLLPLPPLPLPLPPLLLRMRVICSRKCIDMIR